MSKRFIHFGCWNNSGCDYKALDDVIKPSDTALTRVMKKIKQSIAVGVKPEFITIAGDNYYSIVKKDKVTQVKTKILDEADMISGFMCLPEDIKKYLLIGNHDLESLSNRPAPSVCQILDMQKEMDEDPRNNFEMDNLTSPHIMNTHLSDSTIIIMLDTSMYSNEKKDLKKVTVCYQRLFEIHGLEKLDDLNTIEKVRALQKKRVEAFVVDTVKPNLAKIKNIIVIGHHPMMCFKTKEKEDSTTGIKKKKTDTLVMDDLNKLYFDSIYNMLKAKQDINYFYLCADLHQYQVGDISIANKTDKMNIRQYVVGTGGSGLEDLDVDLSLVKPGKEVSIVDTITLTYTNVSNIATHGFLDCLLSPRDDFTPIFVEADMTNFEVKTFKGGYYPKSYTKFMNKTKKGKKDKKGKNSKTTKKIKSYTKKIKSYKKKKRTVKK